MHLKLRIIFHIKTLFLMIWNISWYIKLLVLAVALAKRHFKARIEEHIKKDKKSHFFKNLHSTTTCFDSYNYLSFKTIDKANSKFDLKIKEALHINWRKPNLNAQENHLAWTLLQHTLYHIFLFHLLFSLSLR